LLEHAAIREAVAIINETAAEAGNLCVLKVKTTVVIK
jgi:hypothetical protein